MNDEIQDLSTYLSAWGESDPSKAPVAAALEALSQASIRAGEILRAPECEVEHTTTEAKVRRVFESRLEGLAHVVIGDVNEARAPSKDHRVAILLQPLTCASKLVFNGPVGTLFSVVPVIPGPMPTLDLRGSALLGAGLVSYGSRVALAFSVGLGTHVLTARDGKFIRAGGPCGIGAKSGLFGVDMSFPETWNDALRDYAEERLARRDGPLSEDFITHWTNSLVLEALQVLQRGGVCIYPSDKVKGSKRGCVRRIEEAFPVAFLVENAGGLAIDGLERILSDDRPELPSPWTPFVFGARDEVRRIVRHCQAPAYIGTKSPLFSQRGLFRG